MTQVVVCRIKFQSVASPPKRDGKLLSKVMRVPLRAPFGSIFFTVRRAFRGFDEGFGSLPFWLTSTAFARRWQRVVRYSRCTNFCRPLVGWSFGALAQACKQSSRRFADSLHSFASVFAHGEQHGGSNVGKIRKGVGNELR